MLIFGNTMKADFSMIPVSISFSYWNQLEYHGIMHRMEEHYEKQEDTNRAKTYS